MVRLVHDGEAVRHKAWLDVIAAKRRCTAVRCRHGMSKLTNLKDEK